MNRKTDEFGTKGKMEHIFAQFSFCKNICCPCVSMLQEGDFPMGVIFLGENFSAEGLFGGGSFRGGVFLEPVMGNLRKMSIQKLI